jgi:amino acid transporter
MKALEAQGYSRDNLPYKAPFQPWGAYFALVTTSIITFFKGYDTFIPFKTDTFITAYVAIPIFFVLWASYKLRFKTKVIPLAQVDLISGKREIDEEEEQFLAEQAKLGPRTRLQRIWDSL